MFQRTSTVNKLLDLTKRYRVIQGSSSAGKNYAILAILMNYALESKNTIDIVSMTYDHLRDGAIYDFKNIMQETGRWNDSSWNASNHIYTFQNRSIIRFKALDKPAKAHGPRRDILYLNEANNLVEELFTQLSIRTKDVIFIDYNPTNKFWANDLIGKEDVDFVKVTYKDNEALSQTIIKDLESKRELAKTSDYWKNWCKVYLDGEQGQLEGVIFDNWKIIDTIPDDAELLGYGMDFGFTNDPTTLVAVYRYNGELLLDEVIYQTGLTNQRISKLLYDNEVNKRDEIFADSAEPKSITEIGYYGYNITGAHKGKDSIIYGIQLLLQQPMKVTKRSKNIIEELRMYMWKKDKAGNTLNVPIDNYNHAIDAIRYLVMMKLGDRHNTHKGLTFVI